MISDLFTDNNQLLEAFWDSEQEPDELSEDETKDNEEVKEMKEIEDS